MRTYIALGLMVGIPILMTLAVEFGRRPRDGKGIFALASHSGINVPLAALTAASTFLLVVVVALFAGGSIAEESGWGTLRYLLVRPISRNRLLASKLVVVCILGFAATILISLSGLIAGTIFFGWHPVLTPDGTEFPQGEAIGKLAIATVYVAWCMSGVVALAFMISTITDASLGAVAGAVGLTIISTILDAISSLGSVRDVLITRYWHAWWEGLFASPAKTSDMVNGVLLQLPYVVVFLALAWWWFHRRDVLS